MSSSSSSSSPSASSSTVSPPVSVDAVQAALAVLFHGTDPQQQMQANAWLLHVMNTNDAWSLSLSLLASAASAPSSSAASSELLSFSVNTLYSKCRSEWNHLSLSDRQSMQHQLIHHLRAIAASSYPLRQAILQRLANTIAILAVRLGKGGCHQLVHAMLAGEGGVRVGGRVRDHERYVAVLVLTALADEVKRVKVSYQRSLELSEELEGAAAGIFQLVLDTLQSHLSTSSSSSAAPATDLPIVPQCLDLLFSFFWRNFVSSERALELLSEGGLLVTLLHLLQSLIYAPPAQQRLMEVVVDVLAYSLEAELERLDDDQIAAMQRAMQPVYDLLVSLLPLFNHCHAMCGAAYIPTLPPPSSSSSSLPPPSSVAVASFLSHRFAVLLDAILRADIAAVSQGLGHSLSLIHTHLAFSSYPFSHRSTTQLTLNFWSMLQDRPVKERHKELRQPLFTHLVDVLLTITRYPRSFVRWEERGVGFEGEREEWESYCGEIREVIGVAFPLLNAEFCSVCARHLQGGEGDWTVFTSVVEGLTAIADPFQSLMWEGKATKAVSTALVPLFQRLLHAPSLPPHPVLITSICLLLFELHFWLVEQPTLLHPAVSFLVHAASSSPQAGKAFSRLMGKAGKVLAAESGTVEGLMSAVLSSWGGWTEESRREFCAGLVMTLEHVQPTEKAATHLRHLVSPAVGRINEGLSSPQPQAAQVVEGLRLISSVLWSDSRPVDSVGEVLPPLVQAWQGVRLAMVQGLWEVLERAEQRQWEEEDEVQGQLCRLYGDLLRMIRSGPYASTWVHPILLHTARCFTRQPLPAALVVLESSLSLLHSNPQLFPHLFSVLPAVIQSALKVIEEDMANHVELYSALLHFLGLLTSLASPHFTPSLYALFPPVLDTANRQLVVVDDGYSAAVTAQWYDQLLFSINAHSEQRTRVEARSKGEETEEKRKKREAWIRMWHEHVESCCLTLLTLLLIRPYHGDTDHSDPSSLTIPGLPSSSDDDDDAASSSADRQRFHSLFRSKATAFLFHSTLAFGERAWRGIEREVRRACQRAGWRGGDVERIVRQPRQWLVDGEQRRWGEVFEDVRRLVHGEERIDVLMTYELAWEERRKREEEKAKRAGDMGGSKQQAIQL